MSDLTFNNRYDLVDMLKGIRYKLQECANLDQRLTHSRHRSYYYDDLINRVEVLIDSEKAQIKRIETVGR
jgi:hypothetical protein